MSAGRKHRRQVMKRRTLIVLPSISDDAPSSLKNGLAIRNQATTTGRCPACGATAKFDGPIRPGHVTHGYMAHDNGCPALLERNQP